ncbi:MAG: esterase-like activity of phytase family protein [Oscillatoriales cyanobacterium RM2_1_1]|nr:esterase-like activity of phytase family protein [Oscillatoriales cyanobacterium SM2_3_0]NJO47234.1 esterase-like activity of phytase family protein [Oscillatoriales cyanobacterium RM2_1_1]
MFSDLTLNFWGATTLPPAALTTADLSLSDLTYEIPGYSASTLPGQHFYGVSQHQSGEPSVQFYRLKFDFNPVKPLEPQASTQLEPARSQSLNSDSFNSDSLKSDSLKPNPFNLEAAIPLTNLSGEALSSDLTRPESITFSPRDSIFIATEEIQGDQTMPFIGEFDLTTGAFRNLVPVPPGYGPEREADQSLNSSIQGIQPDLGFKSLTIAPDGFSPGGFDPFRLFAITAAPLMQDVDPDFPPRLRLLHYVIADRASFLVSETLYPLELNCQLVGMVALKTSGSFLSLERSPTSAQIYQVFTGDATDISRVEYLRGNLGSIQPLRKQLLFDFAENFGGLKGLPAELTGMTLGPRLPDGGQSLILIGSAPDNTTSFLVFSLIKND